MPVGPHLRERAEGHETASDGDNGSIIIVVATDAPLLPHQLERVAKRAGTGTRAHGSFAGNGSGDIFVAFSTANAKSMEGEVMHGAEFLDNGCLDLLFEATVQATEEAIVNSMVAARDMQGNAGTSAVALPHGALTDLMKRYGRGGSTPR